MKKSVAVLGLGKYGRSLAESLYNLGADVLAVDESEELINDFSGKCTAAVCANLSNEEEVVALGLKNMDIVVTAMGDDLAASIMAIAVAKEQGVPLVVSKSSSERMSSVLLKVGADRILDPEGEGGQRTARILMSSSFKDFYKIDENMFLIEAIPKNEWIGKTLKELDLRNKMHITVVAVRDSKTPWHFANADKPFADDSVLLVAIEKKHLNNLG